MTGEMLGTVASLLASMATLFTALAALMKAYMAEKASQETLAQLQQVHRDIHGDLPSVCQALQLVANKLGRMEGKLPDLGEGPFWRPATPERGEEPPRLGPRLPDPPEDR